MRQLPLDKLFKPRSIAVIGASTRETAIGFRVIRNLRSLGYEGAIFPINPRYDEVAGLKCLPSVAALPASVDAAFIGIPAADGPAALEACGRHGIRAAYVNASGYADGGPDGRALQERLGAVARAHGIALAGPNNMGLINVHDRVAAWTELHMTMVRPGPLAVIAQSGSIALALAQDERKIGFGYLVTVGNEACLSAADYLGHIARDERVKTVLVFVEAIRDPDRFGAAAAEAHARGKRIVAMKTGSSPRGTALVAAHTDSLAGDDAVYDAFFAHHGIARVRDLDEMLETALLVTAYPKAPASRHFVPVTLSGGEAALVADLGAELGLAFQPLAPATLERLKPAFPPFGRPQNPLDGWGLGFTGENFGILLEALHTDPEIGALGFLIDCPGVGGSDLVYALEMARLASARAARGKPTLFINHMAGSGPNPEVKAILDRAGFPYLSALRPSLSAIGHWLRGSGAKDRAERPVDPRAGAWRRRLAALAGEGEPAAFDLLREAGVPMAACRRVASADEAVAGAKTLGYPVALKGSAAHLPHKTELGLVRLGLASAAAVAEAFAVLSASLARHARPGERADILLQPMAGDGLELIVGIRNDPLFGPLVVVGLGGVLVELMKTVAIRLAPVDEAEALAMLAETRAGELLAGFRGRGPFDAAAAAKAISALSRFASATRDAIAGIEINPLIVLEKGAVGVDVLIQPRADDTPSETPSP